ncbi:MAG: hypothetical protein OEW69_08965 [Nitrospirota bacterium]|nr:hypothetical protein [Nitrospirota bacterium]MDH5743238.1 hypothetical protein [Candidatus Aminicenantes bacterium]
MKNVSFIVRGVDIDEPLKNFITDFNAYVADYNKSNSKQNMIAGLGFIAAALVALLSLFLELKIINSSI